MSEPDKREHDMLGADSKPGEKNVTVELTPPAKAGPENLEILPLIINPYTHRHKLPESNIKHNSVALTKKYRQYSKRFSTIWGQKDSKRNF